MSELLHVSSSPHVRDKVNTCLLYTSHVLETEEELKNLQKGTVIIRSHGVPACIYELLEKQNIAYVDVTCPFVLKIHRIVEKESREGRHIVIVGNADPVSYTHLTGFIRLNGATIGCVANRCEIYNEEGEKTESFENVLSARGCKKAAEFVKFCDAFEIPVLTLTNVKGYKATKCSEANIARNAAELTNAFISATVPKVNIVIGEAFGSAYLTMNSKSTGADMVFAWSNAQIGMMDAKLAAKIMYADADAATVNEKAAEYAMLQSSALSAAKRGYVDTIIEAEDTRKYVIGAFEMLFTKREAVSYTHLDVYKRQVQSREVSYGWKKII